MGMNYRTSSIGLKLDKLLNPTHEDFIHWAYFDGGGYFPGSDEYDLAADKFMRFFKTKTAPVPGN